MAKLIIRIIKVYQTISRLYPPRCRFIPTCSQYTVDALEKYGMIKGVRLSVGRILRCHPFSVGGYDPVP